VGCVEGDVWVGDLLVRAVGLAVVLEVAVEVRVLVGVTDGVLVDILEGILEPMEEVDTLLILVDADVELLVDRSRVGIGGLRGGEIGMPDTRLLTLVPAEETLFTVRVSNSSSLISPSTGRVRKSHSPGLPRW